MRESIKALKIKEHFIKAFPPALILLSIFFSNQFFFGVANANAGVTGNRSFSQNT